jgi:hypothetical protein
MKTELLTAALVGLVLYIVYDRCYAEPIVVVVAVKQQKRPVLQQEVAEDAGDFCPSGQCGYRAPTTTMSNAGICGAR